MEEEGAVENMTRNMEKRIKHKYKKAKNNEGITEGIEEAKNAGKIKAFKDTQISENEDVAEEKRHRKRSDKEKKNNKGTKDSESIMEPGAYGQGGDGVAMSVVERKEKKNKKNREKNKDKDGIFEGGNVEVESDKCLEGDAASLRKSCKELRKETRNRKEIMNNQESEIEKEGAKDVGMHPEICEANDAETVKRKKRKREIKRDKTNRIADNENCRKILLETVNGEKEDFGKKDESRKKKRRRKESDEDNFCTLQQENLPENCEDNMKSTKHDRKELKRKKGHKKKKNCEVDPSVAQQAFVDTGSNGLMHSTKMQSNEVGSANGGKGKTIKVGKSGSNEMRENDVDHVEKRKKKKKTKLMENGVNKEKEKCIMLEENYSDDIRGDKLKSATGGMKKPKKLVEDGSDDQTPHKSNKKVRFSGQDEVFPIPVDLNTEEENDDADNLVRGKRFTHEEDEIVKEAVDKYIQEHDLGEEGLQMVLNTSKHPKLKGCWKEIGSAIPYRPYTAVYYRAQVLFRRSEHRKWTKEECDEILKYQEEHGNQWKELAEELGKHRWHVKDTWRRIKLSNLKKGNWSQDEYQKLFDLVNYDLQLKALEEEKKSKHGMLRDNIPWTAISDKLSTRNQANCCIKWYNQLTSPMVSEGLWADVDDYRLLGALYSLDATCMEDVDWDDLLDNRSGDVCRKRWNQMVLHIGQHGNKSFAEQVEVLAQRYCPHLLDAREAWDSKPKVP